MLTPEEIQSREFLVSLRGYDRDEVHAFLGRVAEQLAQTDAKAAQLQQRLDRLKEQQPSVAGLAEPAPAAQQASPEPSAMFAEIGKETQRILEAAQEAGQQIQRKARQEADRDLQAARGQAAKLIAEGERRREHIERVVSELEQARAAMSVQLRGVGRTIEQTLRELAADGEGSTTVREALGSQATEQAPPAAARTSAGGSRPSRAASAATAEATPPPEKTSEPEPEPEPQPPAADTTDEPAQPDETAEESAPAEPAAQEAPAATAPSATEHNAPADTPTEPVIAADEGTQDAPAAPAPAATEETTAGTGQGRDTASAATATATAPPAAAAAPTEPAMPPADATAAGDEEKDPQGLRAQALSPLHPKLVRKVKRELQEIQNIALDKMRRAKGEGEVEDFLPSDEDTSGLGEGSEELLQQAWRAGAASAAVLADRELGEPDDVPDLAGTFLADAAERVRSGLSSTLRMGLSADEGQQALSDRIGAVFSEFKGAQAEELAATHLIRAYEYGLLGAWTSGGVGARQWVMGREPRCPEAKCRSNDQSGAVPVNESFPSGHDVPPVHIGCTCTTIPAESTA